MGKILKVQLSKIKAFTLTELVVVVVIVGISASFAIPSFQKASLNSAMRQGVLNMKAIYSAGKVYEAKYGSAFIRETGSITLDEINAALGTNIVSDNMTFSWIRANKIPGPGETYLLIAGVHVGDRTRNICMDGRYSLGNPSGDPNPCCTGAHCAIPGIIKACTSSSVCC